MATSLWHASPSFSVQYSVPVSPTSGSRLVDQLNYGAFELVLLALVLGSRYVRRYGSASGKLSAMVERLEVGCSRVTMAQGIAPPSLLFASSIEPSLPVCVDD